MKIRIIFSSFNSIFIYSEVTLFNPQGGVMTYNESGWKSLDGGLSTIWVLENTETKAYRLVTRDESTQTVYFFKTHILFLTL